MVVLTLIVHASYLVISHNFFVYTIAYGSNIHIHIHIRIRNQPQTMISHIDNDDHLSLRIYRDWLMNELIDEQYWYDELYYDLVEHRDYYMWIYAQYQHNNALDIWRAWNQLLIHEQNFSRYVEDFYVEYQHWFLNRINIINDAFQETHMEPYWIDDELWHDNNGTE